MPKDQRERLMSKHHRLAIAKRNGSNSLVIRRGDSNDVVGEFVIAPDGEAFKDLINRAIS
jgi:hypothetical protein